MKWHFPPMRGHFPCTLLNNVLGYSTVCTSTNSSMYKMFIIYRFYTFTYQPNLCHFFVSAIVLCVAFTFLPCCCWNISLYCEPSKSLWYSWNSSTSLDTCLWYLVKLFNITRHVCFYMRILAGLLLVHAKHIHQQWNHERYRKCLCRRWMLFLRHIFQWTREHRYRLVLRHSMQRCWPYRQEGTHHWWSWLIYKRS